MADCTHFKQANRFLTPPPGVTVLNGVPVSGLPIHAAEDGTNVSRWKLTWRERFSILFFGVAWVWVVSGQKHPPISLTCNRTIFND